MILSKLVDKDKPAWRSTDLSTKFTNDKGVLVSFQPHLVWVSQPSPSRDRAQALKRGFTSAF